jgi:hypothetical protein
MHDAVMANDMPTFKLEPTSDELPLKSRWTSPSRYNLAVVQRNLFGQWELLRAWGGRGGRLRSFLVQPAVDRNDALDLLAREAKRRERRGYRPSV